MRSTNASQLSSSRPKAPLSRACSSASERDSAIALAVLARPHQAKTEIRLAALLFGVEPGERTAEAVDQPRTRYRIEQCRPQHEAGYADSIADRQHIVAGKRPQDAGEGHQGDHRVEQAKAEFERRQDEQAHVFGNALVRVVGAAAVGEAQPVLGAAFEPPAEQLVGHPLAPAHLQQLVEIQPIHRGDDEGRRQSREDQQLMAEGSRIAGLQAVVEGAVPAVELDVQPYRAKRQADHPLSSSASAGRLSRERQKGAASCQARTSRFGVDGAPCMSGIQFELDGDEFAAGEFDVPNGGAARRLDQQRAAPSAMR